MRELIQYIICFLLGQKNEHLAAEISYGSSTDARIIIEPSDFFDDGVYLTTDSLPALPLAELEGMPVLFGAPQTKHENGQLHIYADLIASTFFLISRYEECVRREVRDQHGRFIGKGSLPYRAGFLGHPVVEKYGAFLRRCLRQEGVDVAEELAGFQHIYLTHDVDSIWTWGNLYRAARTTIKRILTSQPDKLRPLRAYRDYKQYDPAYTFPWLLMQDHAVQTAYGEERCTPLYFLMGCVEKSNYDVGYMADHSRTADLINYLKENRCEMGYHVSYAASLDMSQAKGEITRIQEFTGRPVVFSRNHYLASREPEDFYALLDAGITDDFTMGYADVAGFRLGTCRPVRWIDPVKRKLTDLILHPMTIMECTLDAKRYMDIQDEEEAFTIVQGLLNEIYMYRGEAVLLWHSPSVDPHNRTYQRSLYRRTLASILQHKTMEKMLS